MTETRSMGPRRIDAVPGSVPALRWWLLDAIRGHGFDDEAVGLALTEATANVVRHAYPDGPGSIIVTVVMSGEGLEVVVADEGSGARSFNLRAAGGTGVGLLLIRELSSAVDIDPGSDGTTVTMWFVRSSR